MNSLKVRELTFFFFWLISINKVVDDNVQLRRNGLKIQSVYWSALISIPQCGKNYEIQKLKLYDSLKCLFKFFFCLNLKKIVQSENHVIWENIRTLNFRNRTKIYIWPELKWLDSRTSSLRYELAKNLFVTTTFEIIGID